MPEIEHRLVQLVDKLQAKSKSSLAEQLLQQAIDAASFDHSFKELVELWKQLSKRDRIALLKMARSLQPATGDPVDPDWFRGIDVHPGTN